MILPEPAQAAVWQCLNEYNYKDAVFLAERVNAEVRTDETLFLLATCYFRSGKPKQAYMILKKNNCSLPQGQFLLAKCCYDLDKLGEAESALLGNSLQKSKAFDDITGKFGQTASTVFQLLGKVYNKTERKTLAAECFRRSLKLNSFLWSSFEALCTLDETLDPAKVFQTPSSQQISMLCQSPFVPLPSSVLPSAVHSNVSSSTAPGICSRLDTPVSSTVVSDICNSQVQWCTPVTTLIPGMGSPEETITPNNPIPPAPTTAPKTKSRKPTLVAGEEGRLRGRQAANLMQIDSKMSASPFTPSFGVLSFEGTPSPQVGSLALHIPSPVSVPENSLSSRFSDIVKDADEKIIEPFKAPVKKPVTRKQHQLSSHNRDLATPVFTQSTNINTPPAKDTLDSMPRQAPPRRSSRLHNASSSSVKENNNKAQNQKQLTKAPVKKTRGKLTRTSVSVTSTRTQQEMNELNREKSEPWVDIPPQEAPEPAKQPDIQAQMLQSQKQSAENLVGLLSELARGYVNLHRYNCRAALEHFNSLSPQQYNTGWVLAQVGRAHFELAEYKQAERVFADLHLVAPHQMEGMEYYSTALWQLQREVQLATLTQELSQIDKQCPETWCCLGNCFSLQKEHDVAIRYLQRAVQVAPEFAYAHTLLGHEYVLTEELDKAMNCFRTSVRINPAQYNAWYGMGMIYYKQEKFHLAESHYRKALTINSQSAVIHCHIGVVQHALKKSELALSTLNKAITIDPTNSLCRFHRASILFAMEKFDESLKELELLKQLIPKESLVYFLMGKVHKKLGNTDIALMNFSWAMDLDPKGANNQIKEALDKRYVTEEDDFGGGFDTSDNLDNSQDSSPMDADDGLMLQGPDTDHSL